MANRLNGSGQQLVDALEDLITRVHQGNCSELIRKVAQADLEDPPEWAQLQPDGKTPTRSARNQLSYRLRKATSVPPWNDVRAIVTVSVGSEELQRGLAHFAELWRLSTGQKPPEKYAGEFRPLSGELRVPPHLSPDELWLDVQRLRTELAESENARKAAEQSAAFLRAELAKAKADDSKDMLKRVVKGMRSVHLEVGEFAEQNRRLFEENERLMADNEWLASRLCDAENNAFESTEQLRWVLGNRVREAEQQVLTLTKTSNLERDLRERLAHSAAMHAAFVGTPAGLPGTGIPNLPLPDVVVLASAPDLGGEDPMTAKFTSYLRAFVLNMYGTDRTHPDIPRKHLDQIIAGELPESSTLILLLHFHPVLRDPLHRMHEAAVAIQADVDRDVPALVNLPLLSLLSDTINLSDGSLDLREGVEAGLTGGHDREVREPVDQLNGLTEVIPIPMPMQRVS